MVVLCFGEGVGVDQQYTVYLVCVAEDGDADLETDKQRKQEQGKSCASLPGLSCFLSETVSAHLWIKKTYMGGGLPPFSQNGYKVTKKNQIMRQAESGNCTKKAHRF